MTAPNTTVVCLCFFILRPCAKCTLVTSVCLHLIFSRGRELKLTDESVLPVTEKEGKGKGKGINILLLLILKAID